MGGGLFSQKRLDMLDGKGVEKDAPPRRSDYPLNAFLMHPLPGTVMLASSKTTDHSIKPIIGS
jgi:hypothetical protein